METEFLVQFKTSSRFGLGMLYLQGKKGIVVVALPFTCPLTHQLLLWDCAGGGRWVMGRKGLPGVLWSAPAWSRWMHNL